MPYSGGNAKKAPFYFPKCTFLRCSLTPWTIDSCLHQLWGLTLPPPLARTVITSWPELPLSRPWPWNLCSYGSLDSHSYQICPGKNYAPSLSRGFQAPPYVWWRQWDCKHSWIQKEILCSALCPLVRKIPYHWQIICSWGWWLGENLALLWMGRIMGIQTSLGGRVEAFLGHVEKLLWSGGQQSLGSRGCCCGWVDLPVCSKFGRWGHKCIKTAYYTVSSLSPRTTPKHEELHGRPHEWQGTSSRGHWIHFTGCRWTLRRARRKVLGVADNKEAEKNALWMPPMRWRGRWRRPCARPSQTARLTMFLGWPGAFQQALSQTAAEPLPRGPRGVCSVPREPRQSHFPPVEGSR